ncbi:hypothetical protein BJ944DRAFT_240594 [Cunninghamella echinulata]|nr:hypothetical protein BJ944DRAFT_240594 [Cunninghamella echinulata]
MYSKINKKNELLYQSEKVETPPLSAPPPVPAHYIWPSSTTQLNRCASLPNDNPHRLHKTLENNNNNNNNNNNSNNSNNNIMDKSNTPLIPSRPVSWHPASTIPSRRTSRFYQDDPNVIKKLDKLMKSDRIATLKNRLHHVHSLEPSY